MADSGGSLVDFSVVLPDMTTNNQFIYFLVGGFCLVYLLVMFIAVSHRRKRPTVICLMPPYNYENFDITTSVPYLIAVKTASLPGSGCPLTFDVQVRVCGTLKASPYYTLESNSYDRKILSRSSTDIFLIRNKGDLGLISSVNLKFRSLPDTTSTWGLDTVTIYNPQSGDAYTFYNKNKIILRNETEITLNYTFEKQRSFLTRWFGNLSAFHMWLSPLNSPFRFGTYSNVSHAMLFFCFLSLMMTFSMMAYVISTNNTIYSLVKQEVVAYTFIANACVLLVIGIFEVVLRNINSTKKKGNSDITKTEVKISKSDLCNHSIRFSDKVRNVLTGSRSKFESDSFTDVSDIITTDSSYYSVTTEDINLNVGSSVSYISAHEEVSGPSSSTRLDMPDGFDVKSRGSLLLEMFSLDNVLNTLKLPISLWKRNSKSRLSNTELLSNNSEVNSSLAMINIPDDIETQNEINALQAYSFFDMKNEMSDHTRPSEVNRHLRNDFLENQTNSCISASSVCIKNVASDLGSNNNHRSTMSFSSLVSVPHNESKCNDNLSSKPSVNSILTCMHPSRLIYVSHSKNCVASIKQTGDLQMVKVNKPLGSVGASISDDNSLWCAAEAVIDFSFTNALNKCYGDISSSYWRNVNNSSLFGTTEPSTSVNETASSEKAEMYDTKQDECENNKQLYDGNLAMKFSSVICHEILTIERTAIQNELLRQKISIYLQYLLNQESHHQQQTPEKNVTTDFVNYDFHDDMTESEPESDFHDVSSDSIFRTVMYTMPTMEEGHAPERSMSWSDAGSHEVMSAVGKKNHDHLKKTQSSTEAMQYQNAADLMRYDPEWQYLNRLSVSIRDNIVSITQSFNVNQLEECACIVATILHNGVQEYSAYQMTSFALLYAYTLLENVINYVIADLFVDIFEEVFSEEVLAMEESERKLQSVANNIVDIGIMNALAFVKEDYIVSSLTSTAIEEAKVEIWNEFHNAVEVIAQIFMCSSFLCAAERLKYRIKTDCALFDTAIERVRNRWKREGLLGFRMKPAQQLAQTLMSAYAKEHIQVTMVSKDDCYNRACHKVLQNWTNLNIVERRLQVSLKMKFKEASRDLINAIWMTVHPKEDTNSVNLYRNVDALVEVIVILVYSTLKYLISVLETLREKQIGEAVLQEMAYEISVTAVEEALQDLQYDEAGSCIISNHNENNVDIDFADLRKDLLPLKAYLAYVMKSGADQERKITQEAYIYPQETNNESVIAINLQNVLDSYYMDEASTDWSVSTEQLWAYERGVMGKDRNILPHWLYSWMILAIFCLTALGMIYTSLRGISLTTKEANSWMIYLLLGIAQHIFVFEPLKVVFITSALKISA